MKITKKQIINIFILIAAVTIAYFSSDQSSTSDQHPAVDQNNPVLSPATKPKINIKYTKSSVIKKAFDQGRSDIQVILKGRVIKVLSDDTQGDKHQRFLVKISGGHVLLIVHNIDLAPRVAGLKVDTDISFHGEYEWNEKGGVVHWTHHDPRGSHENGWIFYQGQKYD
jgi:hypothetical protein